MGRLKCYEKMKPQSYGLMEMPLDEIFEGIAIIE